MASTSDIRDIMDMGHDGPRHSAPKKKKKLVDTQPRLTGISREVQALMGDSVPPVAIVETPKYKSKPSLTMKMFKARHWEDKTFTHGARKDGLRLSHWKRVIPGSVMRPAVTSGSSDVEMTDADKEMEVRFEDEYPSEKWNIEVNVASYTDEQYEKYFQSDDWRKEETDYLIQLCRDFDMRWVLIADRYDPQAVLPAIEHGGEARPERSMEALKARYYTIASKMLELHTPASQMTGNEFQLWEKMRNFDAKAEITRKSMAEKLFERTRDEADEEKVLLEELHRITKNEEDFIKMRKDLYSRLETAPSLRRNERGEEQSTALYQTSQGLSMLLSTLLAKEKRLKRPMPNANDASAAATPNDHKNRHPTYNRRETMDSQADEGPSKKGSTSQRVVRTLTPAEEAKYGVTHSTERLTSGVMFRHEKINRITTAKSQVQTQKIQSALTELGIPPRLLMPTERVCREFERLVAEVQILLDTRRVLEKVGTEVKILEEQKRIRLGQPKEGEDGDAMRIDNSQTKQEDETEADNDKVASFSRQDTNGDESVVQDGDDDGDANPDQSAMADDDEAEQSVARNDEDDEDEEEEDDEREGRGEEEDEDDDEDDDDDDAPGLEDLERANQVTDDEDEDRDGEVDDSQADGDEEQDEDDEDENRAEAEVEESANADDDDDDEDAAEEPSRPTSAHSGVTRSNKRSASVLSDASRSGSNKSGAGRKRRR